MNDLIVYSLKKTFNKEELEVIFQAMEHYHRYDNLEYAVLDILSYNPVRKVTTDIIYKIRKINQYQLETLIDIYSQNLQSIIFNSPFSTTVQ